MVNHSHQLSSVSLQRHKSEFSPEQQRHPVLSMYKHRAAANTSCSVDEFELSLPSRERNTKRDIISSTGKHVGEAIVFQNKP